MADWSRAWGRMGLVLSRLVSMEPALNGDAW
jgi:hypothetical protein